MDDTKKINVEVNDGKVTFYLDDFWHAFNDEQKREFIKVLTWEKEVFDDFVDAIINEKVVTDRYNYRVYDVRQRLLESLGVIEKNHFRSLLHEFEQVKNERDSWENDYNKIYHAIPSDLRLRMSIPRHESYKHAEWASDEKVEAEMQARSEQCQK